MAVKDDVSELGDSIINFIIQQGLIKADESCPKVLIWHQSSNWKIGGHVYEEAFKLNGHMFGIPLSEWNEVKNEAAKKGIATAKELAQWIRMRPY